jgi:hypothetical protein
LLGVAGDAYRFEQGASCVDNLLRAVVAKGGEVNEVGANSEGEGAGGNVIGGIGEIDAAGGDEARFGKRSAEGFDVFGAADASARKNFDERGASVERRDHFRGSERARDGQLLTRGGDLQNGKGKPGTDEELGAGFEAHFGLIGGDDGAGSREDRAAALANDLFDDISGVGNGHGDFDDGDTAGADGVDRATGFVGRRGAHDGDDADFVDAVDGGVDGHDRCIVSVFVMGFREKVKDNAEARRARRKGGALWTAGEQKYILFAVCDLNEFSRH